MDRRRLLQTELAECAEEPAGEPEVGELGVGVCGPLDAGFGCGGGFMGCRIRFGVLGGFRGSGFEEREVILCFLLRPFCLVSLKSSSLELQYKALNLWIICKNATFSFSFVYY